MLQAVSYVSLHGVYVCGNTSKSTGLTVTFTKESGNSKYSLKAGALVLGDQGKDGFLMIPVDCKLIHRDTYMYIDRHLHMQHITYTHTSVYAYMHTTTNTFWLLHNVSRETSKCTYTHIHVYINELESC